MVPAKVLSLKTLLGLQPALQGEVCWQQQTLSAYTQAELARNIAYVPQAHQHLFPFLVQGHGVDGAFCFFELL